MSEPPRTAQCLERSVRQFSRVQYAQSTSPSTWLDRARSVAANVERWRDESERERRLCAPLLEHLREARLFELSAPPDVSGRPPADELTALETIEELSRQDASVGWTVKVTSLTAILASRLRPSALREVYGADSGTCIGGTVVPKGCASPVEGGFRVTGRWPFGSGCHHARWMIGSSSIVDGDRSRRRADGRPEVRGFLVPIRECELLDTWYTAGMRATGSDDWEVRDVFVPEERSFSLLVDRTAEPGAIAMADVAHYSNVRVAAVALGIARAAVETVVTLGRTKVPARCSTSLARQPTAQDRLGRAEGALRSGRALLYETVRVLANSPEWPLVLDDDQSASVRLAATTAARAAVECVDLVLDLAGTSAIFEGSRLDRCVRDLRVVTSHSAVAYSHFEAVGRQLWATPVVRTRMGRQTV